MKLIGIICVSMLILALAIPAYAETQNVKVSGDITIRGVYRDQFDLNKADNEPDSDNFAMSTVELQIDADLTDNVSTCIRLVNQRNWGDSDYPHQSQYYNGAYELYWKSRLVEVGVDLAYVTLKEMIFEPLTLTIGRQDIWFGRGFIIAVNQVDPGFIGTSVVGGVVLKPTGGNADQRAIGSPELTAYNSFDAVRATIDFEKYAPFVVDLVYAKIDEGMIGPEDDVDLYGVNAGYTFDVYNAEAEAYYWLKFNDEVANPYIGDADYIHVIGTRGSFQPVPEWVFAGELAYQFGHNNSTVTQQDERYRSAWAADVVADYLGWVDYAWSPKVGAEYIFYSGDNDTGIVNSRQTGGTDQGWDPMFTIGAPMAIRPWLGTYYMTDRHPAGADCGVTNQHMIILSGSIQPLDDLTFEARGAGYWFDQQPDALVYATANADGSYIGSELNLITTYDYTEDVTFSLLNAWFFPGDHYDLQGQTVGQVTDGLPDLNPQIATEIVGTMKVSF